MTPSYLAQSVQIRQSDVGVAAAYGVVLMAVSAAVFALGADQGSGG